MKVDNSVGCQIEKELHKCLHKFHHLKVFQDKDKTYMYIYNDVQNYLFMRIDKYADDKELPGPSTSLS